MRIARDQCAVIPSHAHGLSQGLSASPRSSRLHWRWRDLLVDGGNGRNLLRGVCLGARFKRTSRWTRRRSAAACGRDGATLRPAALRAREESFALDSMLRRVASGEFHSAHPRRAHGRAADVGSLRGRRDLLDGRARCWRRVEHVDWAVLPRADSRQLLRYSQSIVPRRDSRRAHCCGRDSAINRWHAMGTRRIRCAVYSRRRRARCEHSLLAPST